MEKLNIQELGEHLLSDQKFISSLFKMFKSEKTNTNNQKVPLELLIEEVRQLLHDLIHQQLESELNQIIEDNNKILREIKDSMMRQSKEKPLHDFGEDISFNQVHRLMDEERKKVLVVDEMNDASLDRSISAFVELKVQTIEEKVITLDKRIRGMQDKYETNLKSIWNVLSITQGAIFDHLKQTKTQSCLNKSIAESEPEVQKKSFFDIFKRDK